LTEGVNLLRQFLDGLAATRPDGFNRGELSTELLGGLAKFVDVDVFALDVLAADGTGATWRDIPEEIEAAKA